MAKRSTRFSIVNRLNKDMIKIDFNYFAKKAEMLQEAAAIKHPLIKEILGGEGPNRELYSDIGSRILHMISKGTTPEGEKLVDSSGEAAPGLTGSMDDRYNKWLLTKLIEFSDTRDNEYLDEEMLDGLMNGPIGRFYMQKLGPEDGEEKVRKLFYAANKSSNIQGQAARIVLSNSINDDKDYFTFAPEKAPLMKSAMMLIIKQNPDILKDPEFRQLVLNPTDVADYMNNRSTGRTILHNPTSIKSAANKLQSYDLTPEDEPLNPEDIYSKVHELNRVETSILPLLKVIRKQHGYKYGKETGSFDRRHSDKFKSATSASAISGDEDILQPQDPVDAQLSTMLGIIVKFVKSQAQGVKDIVDNNKLGSYSQRLRAAATELDLPQQAVDSMNDLDMEVLDELLAFLDKRSKSGDGITMEEIDQVMDTILQQKGDDPEAEMTVDYLKDEIDHSVGIAKLIQQHNASGKESKYKGFDVSILKQVLDTPEKVKAFDEWYIGSYIPSRLAKIKKDLAESRSEVPRIGKAELDRGIETFKSKTTNKFGDPVDRSNMNMDINYDEIKAHLKSTPQHLWSPYDKEMAIKLGLSGDGEKVTKDMERQAINAMKSQTEKEFYKKSPLRQESYVMDYMTEQVSKDRFQTKGEFKERGFRKPINYAHWLDINK